MDIEVDIWPMLNGLAIWEGLEEEGVTSKFGEEVCK
jgi:hypothetical protein